ncbi:hypothetical protein N431DRAFT_390221, partial [Stipitochalara longipes BDJ]
MLLYELNDDILLCIVTEIALDLRRGPNALFSLALTCRSLSRLARPVIPDHIFFGIPSQKFKLFKRTLKGDPTYGHQVVSFWRDVPDRNLPALSSAQLNSFLRKLPNLRTLRSLQSESDGPSAVPSLLSQHQPLKQTLQDISLHETLVNVIDLFKLVLFPHLRRLKVEVVQRCEIAEAFSPLSRHGTKSELQVLELGWYIGPHAMKTILLHCADSLKELICPVPVNSHWIDDWPADRDAMLRTFSPMRILPTLFPVAQSLTRLELDTRRQDWPNHDGSRLDLSGFVALKDLTASALCFLAPLPQGIPRNGLYRLLPRSLRRLHLDFGLEIGVFYSVDDAVVRRIDRAGRDLFLSEDMDPSSYEWIVELAKHKTDHLLALQDVELSEHNMRGGPSFIPEKWDPPLKVGWAFDEAVIDLTVIVRSP